MENVFKLKLGKEELNIIFEDWAEKANGSCLVSLGQTTVLATAVMAKEEKKQDFLPLTVEYLERYYAAGKIIGPRYIKREGKPSDEAIANARLIDRTIRPLFPKELKREIQVIVTVLSWDTKNDPDIPAILASSLALAVSDIPWEGPVIALRIGKRNDEFLLNPYYQERESSQLDIIFAGLFNENKEPLINMIEGEGEEVEEKEILKAFEFAKPYLRELFLFLEGIVKKRAKKKIILPGAEKDKVLEKKVFEFLEKKLEKIIFLANKEEKQEKLEELKEKLISFVEENWPDDPEKRSLAFSLLEKEIERIIRESILKKEKRPDGRKLDQIRELEAKVSILPRAHGSGFFMRGQTKTLSILTLGSPGDVQLLEGMEIVGKKRFIHHYNFLPYSVGEAKALKGPGRREIGHGMLVEKALLPLIPSFDQFPYTIRVVSEVICSNGSTSMACVTSSSLALMDAGVPIKEKASGVSIGLIFENFNNYKLLTDIQGPEDYSGDMDFKVAGTKNGVTALQMDVKIKGINKEILAKSLQRAKKAREEILAVIDKVLSSPRPELSPFAPRIITLKINPEKIREVIGPGGKVINEIIEATGTEIDIQSSGKIFITAEDKKSAEKAALWIKKLTRELQVGQIFQGKVKKIYDFGAMVEILPDKVGLIHISQLAPYRIKRVEDIIKVGDIIPVKITSIDEQGRISLSLKQAQGKFQKKNYHLKEKNIPNF